MIVIRADPVEAMLHFLDAPVRLLDASLNLGDDEADNPQNDIRG